MDITHDNVCSSMLSCFYSHLLSTGRPISSYYINMLISLQSDLKKLFRLSLIIDLVNDSIGSNECRDSTNYNNLKAY